jgi:flagellar hook protein FlgE
MFSGVSGLRVHQTKMDVIANNISNVNTFGYKSSRVTFAEIFSQTTAGASGASPETGRGGVNAMQIGLGANVASIDMLMTNGAAQRTDNPYDLMIQGDGFFIVGDTSGTYFTRAGAFRLDEAGNLVGPNGMQLQGWKAQQGLGGVQTVPKTGLQGIQISGEDEHIGAEVTTYEKITGNLNALTDPVKESSLSFYDSLGNKYNVKMRYEYDQTAKQWNMTMADRATIQGSDQIVYFTNTAAQGGTPAVNDLSGATPKGFTLTTVAPPANDPGITFLPINGNPILKFDANGDIDPASLTSLQFTVVDAVGALNPNSAFAPIITVDLQRLTQQADKATVTVEPDGAPPGSLNGVSIGSDGKISGKYSNGKTKILWQIPVAKFKNPAGLERVGNNLYSATPNSGEFDGVGEEAAGGTSLLPGVLEMSNVDLASEFTDMITTQRGFQANSRIITTSDEMLQELVNLKR